MNNRYRCLSVVGATSLLVVVVGCGVPADSKFKEIDRTKVPFGLAGTTTSTTAATTTTTTIPLISVASTVPPPPTFAFQTVTLFFVVGRQLVKASTQVVAPVFVPLVLAQLEKGPPEGGVSSGIRTAIPAGTTSTARVEGGVAIVDLPPSFFEAMIPQDQRLAVAQYVLTLTQVSGVGQVRFTQNDVPIPVIGGDGGSTEPEQLLTAEDYQRLLDPGVPDVIETTTTTTVPETSTTAPPLAG